LAHCQRRQSTRSLEASRGESVAGLYFSGNVEVLEMRDWWLSQKGRGIKPVSHPEEE